MDTNKLSPNAFHSPENNPFDELWRKTMNAVSMSAEANRRSPIRLYPRNMDTNKLSPNTFLSPGNNPFDDLWRKTMNAVSTSAQANRRSSIQLCTDFSNTGRISLSFRDLNASGFGTESLDILPPDFGRDSLGFVNKNNLETGCDSQANRSPSVRLSTDFSNTGRISLSFRDLKASEFGRESLGILPPDFGRGSLGFMNISNLETDCESQDINTLRESLSFRRENLGVLNLQDLGRESLDCGRESLGILHLKSPDVKFEDEDKRVTDIFLATIEEHGEQSYNVLNTAFLQPNSRKSSIFSSTSSHNPSFNSVSLEGPSRIYSVPSLKDFKDTANLTYSTSSALSSIHSPLNKGKIFSPSELNVRSRIQSVPATIQFSSDNKSEFGDITERKFWSSDRTTVYKTLEKRHFHEILDFKEDDTSSEFHDSVFIEGHVIAEKIGDGSILNESIVGEVGILDSTPQPDWSNLSVNENKNDCEKCDTETVFKAVDKMLPPPSKDSLDAKLKTSKADSNASNENIEKVNTSEENSNKLSQSGEQNISKLLHNISDIEHEPKNLSSNRKNPKEILENLSELLNCVNPSEKQKSEGKNLLNSLADILCESRSSATHNHDDSGHSSINDQSDSSNKENHEFFEVLDLRAKTTDQEPPKQKTRSNTGVLDLSLKSKPIANVAGKRLSQSCSSSPNVLIKSRTEKKSASASSLDMSKNKTSNSSVASNDSKNNSNLVKLQITGKLRQKHSGSNLKKGPMKAIIPVGDMKKKINTSGTPEKNEHVMSTIQSKRTSTPINEPKLKPMAASTPTPHCTKDSPRSSKNPRNMVDSPLAGPTKPGLSNTYTRNRAYSSAGLPRTSMTNMTSKLRRNSVSDVKKPNESLVRRRNSVERETGIMSAVARARHTVGSPYLQARKQNPSVENKPLMENKGKSGESRQLSVAKSNNLDSKSDTDKKVTNKLQRTVSTTEMSSKIVPSPSSKNSKTSTSTAFQVKARVDSRERTNSVNSLSSTKESRVKNIRRSSVGNVSGILSSLAKIRQDILHSPSFSLMKEDALNQNYIGLSENKGLGRTSNPQIPQLKKTGKENIEK